MKKLGIRFKDIEKHKPAILKLSPETAELFKPKKNERNLNDFIIDYLGRKLFDEVQEEWDRCFDKSFPKEIKESCLWCTGKSKLEEDKKCGIYKAECQMNYFFAAREFVHIVERNKPLIKGEQLKKELTIKFFECFTFCEGRVIFDLEKMTLLCLHAGFLTLSQILAQNEPLQSLSLINDSIDKLNSEKLEFEMFADEPPIHIDPQLKFFKNKQEHFKEKHFIQKEKNVLNSSDVKTTKGEILSKLLNEYGFQKIVILKNKDVEVLIEHLSKNDCPYQLAYFDHLGFNKYLLEKYCKSERDLQKILAKVLNTSERNVRGNLNVLKNIKSGDRKRYSAYRHKETVENHFENLK